MTEKEENVKIVEYTLSKTRKNSKAWEMMVTTRNNINEWSNSKIGRWVGYAQCLLVAEGVTTIDTLREDIRTIIRRHDD
jgi:hypothetical protein